MAWAEQQLARVELCRRNQAVLVVWLDLTKIEGCHLSLVDQLEQDREAGGGKSAPDGAGQQVPQQGELPGGVVRPGQPRPRSTQRKAQHQLSGGQAGRRCQQGG